MKPTPETNRNVRHLVAIVAIALSFYLLLLPTMLDRLSPLTGDEPFYVMTAISLLRDGDLDESNNYARGDYEEFYPDQPLPADWNGWQAFPRPLPPHPATSDLPGLHTKHGLGLSLLIALPFEIFGRTGATLLVVVAAALLAGQMFLLARESGGSPGLAAAIALGLAIAMPIGPYAFLIFPAIPAALLLTYAIRRVAIQENSWIQWLLTGCAIGFLPWLHQRFAPTSAILALLIVAYLVRTQSRNAALASLTPIAIGAVSLLAYNQWLYGTPFQRTEDHAGFSGPGGTLNGAFGLLLDAQWGLWIAAPVMILALAAVPQWIRARRRLVLTAFAAVAPYLLIVAAYQVWWGEWGPPARYLIPVVPLAAGPLAAWLSHSSPAGRLIAAGTWLFGIVLTTIGYQDPQRFYHHPDGSNNLYERAGDIVRVDLNDALVAFQPYALDSFASRLWISAFALIIVATVAYLINGSSLPAADRLEHLKFKMISLANR